VQVQANAAEARAEAAAVRFVPQPRATRPVACALGSDGWHPQASVEAAEAAEAKAQVCEIALMAASRMRWCMSVAWSCL